jgi:glyoxylase-like metal-dependent hydrolase (beta-lactamase superfamily II)
MIDGVIRLTDPLGPRLVHFYELPGDGGCTLFDAGLPGSVISRLGSGEIPGPVIRGLISHADADHLGDAGSLQSAEMLCHKLDRDWICNHDRLVSERYGPAYASQELPALRRLCGPDFEVQRTVEEGEILRIGRFEWRVLHVPGHTHGHIALWREWDGVLLIGDAILGFAVPDSHGKPSMPATHCHIGEYLQTIHRLASLPVSTVLSGHWPALDMAEFRQLLADSRHCVERDLEFLLALSAEPHTTSDYIATICSKFRRWPESEDTHYFFAVTGYLEYLTARSLLRELEDGRFVIATGVAHA